MSEPLSFEARLRIADEILSRIDELGADAFPGHMLDQARAAALDMYARVHRFTGKRIVDSRGVELGPVSTIEPEYRKAAYLLAAVMTCSACPHIRNGPQIAHVYLEARRMFCDACARAMLTEIGTDADWERLRDDGDDLIAVPADTCEICESKSLLFHTMALFEGPIVYHGSVCRHCYSVLTLGKQAPLPSIGRNEPCPCGSGRKWKHCHQRQIG